VDKFKDINDQFGHETGDNVLKHLSNNLRFLAGSDCCIARLGGEEFAVASFEVPHDGAFEFAEKIRNGIQNSSLQTADREISYTVSIGYCVVVENHSLNEVLRNADTALYTAKRTGRNRTICFDPNLVPLAPDAEDLIQTDEKTASNHAASSN
jgi:diguanylate cyclase (GGDEF)-like protein